MSIVQRLSSANFQLTFNHRPVHCVSDFVTKLGSVEGVVALASQKPAFRRPDRYLAILQ